MDFNYELLVLLNSIRFDLLVYDDPICAQGDFIPNIHDVFRFGDTHNIFNSREYFSKYTGMRVINIRPEIDRVNDIAYFEIILLSTKGSEKK